LSEITRNPDFEYPDPTPVVARPNLRMPVSAVLRTRLMIQQEISRQAALQGSETFEEADDFSLSDEEWVSPYEQVFEPPVPVDSAHEGGKTAASTAAESVSTEAPEVAPNGEA